MSYGPDRWGKRPKSSAIQAGGVNMFYRHPKLAGHVSDGVENIDEVDVSKACKLNDTFLDAAPAMDSAYQEVLVNGAVITVTNKILAGVLTLQVLERGGFVGRGCFITALQLVQSSGDNVGGTFTVVRNFDGVQRVRVYFGVFVKQVPHEKIAGNAVVPYPVQLVYAGWFDGVGPAESTKQYIWAVGNSRGTYGSYKAMSENKEDGGKAGSSVELFKQHTGGSVDHDDLESYGDVPDDLATGVVNSSGALAVYPNVLIIDPPQEDLVMVDLNPAPTE